MTTRNDPWPEGTPAWADAIVPDRHQAREFYSRVLGWGFTDESPAEMGYYTQGVVDGRVVAGFGEAPAEGAPFPPAWLTYLAVDRIEPVVQRAADAGATVLMPLMEVGDFGRMAVLADPTGAVFGLWQAGTHSGAQLCNEPGSITWNEVMTRDLDRAKDFYAAVFGYRYGDMSGDGFRYATLNLGDQPVGGIGQLPDDTPADVPAHWLTYFKVRDVDEAVQRVGELGGQVLQEPWDTEFGRMALVSGPAGEAFSVMADPPQQATRS